MVLAFRYGLLVSAASWVLGTGAPAPADAQTPPQREQLPVHPGPLGEHDFTYFRMAVPASAHVFPVRPPNRVRTYLSQAVDDSASSCAIFVTVFRIPNGMTIRDWVRGAFLDDSVTSAQADWGVPEPVRTTRLGTSPALRFGPTCGDCDMFTIYSARGDTAVSLRFIFDDRLYPRQASALRSYYTRMMASFRWRGA